MKCVALQSFDHVPENAIMCINQAYNRSDVALYKTEYSIVRFYLDDFHNISGKYSPKKETVDKIANLSGISFIQQSSRHWTELREDPLCGKRTVFLAEEQGRKQNIR
jgi:hypothetical protein